MVFYDEFLHFVSKIVDVGRTTCSEQDKYGDVSFVEFVYSERMSGMNRKTQVQHGQVIQHIGIIGASHDDSGYREH